MIKTRVLLVALAAALLVTQVDARAEFVARIPNGANVNGVEALGHKDGTGSSEALNTFGAAFEKAGKKWTTALCQADSDGDGQTNGQELGDPCCAWTSGGTPKFTSGVSHPGDATKTVDATVLANNACSSSGASNSTATTTTAPTTTTAAPTASSSASKMKVVTTTTAALTVAVVLTQW